jgi:CHAT domain-containing protein
LEVWNEVKSHPGGDKYLSERTGTISWPDIRAFVDSEIDGFALVEYEVLDDRVEAFIVRQGASEPEIVTIPIKIDALIRSAQALYREMDGSSGDSVRRETWTKVVEPLALSIGPALEGVRVLCIVAHLMLHHMPIHTLGPPGSTLMDQMVVYYAPSAEMAARLSRSPRRLAENSVLEALVVADTLSDLRHAREEGKYVAGCLGVEAILGEDATCSDVLPRLEGVGIAHFACHGQVRIDFPRWSSVIMADGPMTAAQLQDSKLSCAGPKRLRHRIPAI